MRYVSQLNKRSINSSYATQLIKGLLQPKFDPFGQQVRDSITGILGRRGFRIRARDSTCFGPILTEDDHRPFGTRPSFTSRLVWPWREAGRLSFPEVRTESWTLTAPWRMCPPPHSARMFMSRLSTLPTRFPFHFLWPSENQVDSSTAGAHISHSLDQNGSDSAENIQFGSFELPPLLDDSQRKMIDDWAAQVVSANDGSALITQQSTGLDSVGRMASSSSYSFKVEYPNGLPPQRSSTTAPAQDRSLSSGRVRQDPLHLQSRPVRDKLLDASGGADRVRQHPLSGAARAHRLRRFAIDVPV